MLRLISIRMSYYEGFVISDVIVEALNDLISTA